MRIFKYIILILVVALIIFQFVRPQKNISSEDHPQSFVNLYHPPDSVKQILKAGCMNCHSDNTAYPWYFKIQPAAAIIAHHINEGKDNLNLDEFGKYSTLRQRSKMQDMRDQVRDNVMPLKSYRLFHPEARFSKTQKKVLMHWLSHQVDSLNQLEMQ